MEIIDSIIKKAFKVDSGMLHLVIHGVKPCGFITFKFKGDISSIAFKAINYTSNVVYFVHPQSKREVNLMIFNLKLIEKKLPQVNKYQSSYRFKNSSELISKLIKVYKNKKNLRARLGIKKHAALNFIQGIIFGFPLKSIKIFDTEVTSRKLAEGRSFYETKLSPSLGFVGYPTTKLESKQLLKKWENSIKKFKDLNK